MSHQLLTVLTSPAINDLAPRPIGSLSAFLSQYGYDDNEKRSVERSPSYSKASLKTCGVAVCADVFHGILSWPIWDLQPVGL